MNLFILHNTEKLLDKPAQTRYNASSQQEKTSARCFSFENLEELWQKKGIAQK